MDHTPKRIPSPLLSLVPILVLVTLLFVTIHTFGSDALSGGSQVVLLTATAVCCLIDRQFLDNNRNHRDRPAGNRAGTGI